MPAPSAETIARAFGGTKSGAGWMALCPAHDDRTPSLSIRGTDDGRVLFYCHAGCDQSAVIAVLSARGLWPGEQQDNKCPPRAGPKPNDRAQPRRDDRQRTFAALKIWSAGTPAAATAVADYLKARGINLTPPPALKLHRELQHPTGDKFPAMIALVVHGASNQPVGIHRTFLDRNSHAKASVTPAKMMLGPCRGGVVRLGPLTSPLLIGEGIETCLAAMQAAHLSAWAALSTSGMTALELPSDVRDVIILADGDVAGERAAVTAAQQWATATRRVRIARPPLGSDFNDVLLGRDLPMIGGAL